MPKLPSSLLAFGFGCVAALGHAPFGLWWAALIGLSGMIRAVQQAARPSLAAWAGGVGYFGVTLHWIVEPFLVDAATHGWMAPFALIFMAGGLALFWGLAGWFSARVTPGAMGLALWLAAAEMARGHVLTGFPWALPAYIWAETGVRMTAAFVGPYGLSALTLMLCALPWVSDSRAGRIALAASGAVVLLALSFRPWLPTPADPVERSGPRVALIQPNVPQGEKWDPLLGPVHARRVLDMTAEVVGSGVEGEMVELVVWPESALIWTLDQAGDVLEEASAASGGRGVLTGINRRSGEDWYNAAALIEDGAAQEVYDKVHLVPFGEYIPFRVDLVRRMAGFSGFGFTPGARVRAIDTPLGRAVVFICYEAIFPGHSMRAGERPDLLIQITNDAWFGTFAGPYQHLDQARFRAVEQGLPLVRVANTGVSALITPQGDIAAEIPLGERGWTTAAMPPASAPTLYSGTGDLPVAFFLAAALGLVAIAKRIRA